jgi:drug/metabolite transporter (DMT)-like permease
MTLSAVTSGVIFFGEDLTLDKILGGTIILVGVYLARRQ